MNNTWVTGGNTYSLREISSQIKKLPTAVYKIEEDPFGNIFLSRMEDKFTFPYKIYGKDDKFVQRVLKTWQNTKGNLGILLNGIRGTGKTVTAQQICNIVDNPVLILTKKYAGLVNFLNEVNQDITLFIDEYEKIFEKNDHTLLTIMDGALKTEDRILFLFTTNELNIERNLLQRPSRIRYIKTYSDLDLSVVTEIVDDMLINKDFKKETIKMIGHLPIITIDLVKAVVEEVNIHNESPEFFKDILNADDGDNDNSYTIYRVVNNEKVYYKGFADVSLDIAELEEDDYHTEENNNIYVNGKSLGVIKKIIDNQQLIIAERVLDEEESKIKGSVKFKFIDCLYIFEKAKKSHKNFLSYVF